MVEENFRERLIFLFNKLPKGIRHYLSRRGCSPEELPEDERYGNIDYDVLRDRLIRQFGEDFFNGYHCDQYLKLGFHLI